MSLPAKSAQRTLTIHQRSDKCSAGRASELSWDITQQGQELKNGLKDERGKGGWLLFILERETTQESLSNTAKQVRFMGKHFTSSPATLPYFSQTLPGFFWFPELARLAWQAKHKDKTSPKQGQCHKKLRKYFDTIGKRKTESDFLTLILKQKTVFILHCILEAMDHYVFNSWGSMVLKASPLPRALVPGPPGLSGP